MGNSNKTPKVENMIFIQLDEPSVFETGCDVTGTVIVDVLAPIDAKELTVTFSGNEHVKYKQ